MGSFLKNMLSKSDSKGNRKPESTNNNYKQLLRLTLKNNKC